MPRRKRDSDKPKRPLTAYMLFCQEKRAEIKKNNPTVSFGEIGKLLGQAWQQLSPDDRKPYEDSSKEAKAHYLQEMKEYKDKHPDEEEERPKKRQKKGKGKGKGKTKRKKKDKNAPKKPCSAFFWFSKEQRPKLKAAHPEASFGDLGKMVGEAWRNLPEADRGPYVKSSLEDKERYQREIKDYKPPKESSSESESSSSESESSSSSSSSDEKDDSSSSESESD